MVEFPVAHVHDSVCAGGYSRVMGHNDHRKLLFFPHFSDQIQNLHCVDTVQATSWLVGEKDIRIVDQRARDCDALTLSPRHLARKVIHPLAQPESGQKVFRAFLVVACEAWAADGGNENVVKRRQGRNEMEPLEDEADVVPAK